MNRIFSGSLLVQLLLIVCFIWFGWQADQTMDNTGIGDVHEWNRLNGLVDIALFGAAVVWLVTILLSFVGRAFGSIRAQLAIGLPPFFSSWMMCLMVDLAMHDNLTHGDGFSIAASPPFQSRAC